MPRLNRLAALLLLAATGACADGASPLAPDVSGGVVENGPSFTIYDGAHAGASANLKFFFLPPMVENPKDDKKPADGTLSPVVEICELTSAGVCGRLIERFTSSGGTKTNERVRWLGNHYQVNFKAGSYTLDPDKRYRVTVLVNNLVLGWADARFTRDGDNGRGGDHGECRDGRDDDDDHHGGGRHNSYSQNGFQQNSGGSSNHRDDDRDGRDNDRDGRGGRDDDRDDRDGRGGRDDDRDGHHDGDRDHDRDNDRDNDRDHDDDCDDNGNGNGNGHGNGGMQQYVTLSCNETLPIKFRIGQNIAGGIRLTPPTQTVTKGTPAQYAATVTNLHGASITGVPITWTSSDPTIATVDANGKVTTLKTGTVTITATAERVKATATLVVKPLVVRVEVQSVTIDVGETATVVAVGYDANGNPVLGEPVTWSIQGNDGTIIRVTSISGESVQLKGVSAGVATLNATVANVTGTGTATVLTDLSLPTICTGDGLRYFGTTTVLTTGTCGIRLTPSETWTSGSAWSSTKQPVASGFEVRFQMRMSNPGPADLVVQGNTDPGADGIVFVLQNMAADAVGGAGIGLGYQGLTSSVGIEFDTWLNPGEGDPSGNHVSIHTNGLGPNNADESYSIGSAVVPGNWYDGQVHEVVIHYVPGTITVTIDGVLVLTAPLTLTNVGGANLTDADGKMWAGFTSATGSAYGTHDILSWSLTTDESLQ
jgi:hypothetical protein